MSKLSYNIKAYSFPNIGRLKSAIIEDIDNFLEKNYPYIYSLNNLQPLSIEQTLTLKLPLDETMAAQSFAPTYMRITPAYDGVEDNKHYYYFVEKITRLANKTISLDLTMDTLNSFSLIIENGLTARTMVAREHRDRFYNVSGVSYPYHQTIVKKIDQVGEGFSALKLKDSDNKITAPSPMDALDWYLIYKTKFDTDSGESDNPISCFLCASEQLTISKGSSGGPSVELTADDLSDGVYYYLTPESAASFSVVCLQDNGATKTITFGSPASIYLSSSNSSIDVSAYNFVFVKNGSYIKVYVSGTTDNDILYTGAILPLSSGVNVTKVTLNLARSARTLSYLTNQQSKIALGASIIYNAGTGGDIFLYPFSSVKKDDSRLVKILRLPYAPSGITYSNGLYVFPSEWEYQSDGYMKLADGSLSQEFSYSFPEINLNEMVQSFSLTGYDIPRFLSDPKLLHSDFYTLKYSYDTFALEFKLEHLIYKGYGFQNAPYLGITFKPTNTINSNFLFIIENKNSFFDYKGEEDYHVLLSSRNNEVTIYSNAYLNYLKTGYNYDKKSRAIESASRWGGVVISAASAAVSAVAGGPIGALGAVSLGIGAVSQMASAIEGQINSDNTQAAKLQELRAQSTSVAGVDDVDLLKAYTDNRLHEMRYAVNDQTKAMLEDYFYYFGYATNRQKLPNLSSRIWFNYVQCTPYFNDGAYSVLAPFLEDISNKLQAGVTIFHAVNESGTLKWDLAQEKENLESWFKV
jgi:hypothetical protein